METREIKYDQYSINAIVPTDFQIDLQVLEEDMQHAKEYREDLLTALKETIAYGLDTEFRNAVREKNITKSTLYMFAGIKNGTAALVDTFKYALTDIDPQIITLINGQNILDGDTRQRLETIAKILISYIN
jgi:hypothetical protein